MFIFSSAAFSVDLIAMIVLKGKNNYCFSHSKLQNFFCPFRKFEEELKFGNLRNNFWRKKHAHVHNFLFSSFFGWFECNDCFDLEGKNNFFWRLSKWLQEIAFRGFVAKKLFKRKWRQCEGKTKSCTTNFLSCKRMLIIFRNQNNSLLFQFFIVPWGNPTILISVDSKNLKTAKMLSLVLRKIKPAPQVT